MNAYGNRSSLAAPSATPSSLLERVRSADDGPAWERLLRLYGPTVTAWCRAAGVTDEDAADVRQDVFQAVAQGIVNFHRDRPGDSFRGWLYTITRRRLLDHWRRAARLPRPGVADQPVTHSPPPDSGGEPAQTWDELRRGVGSIRGEFEERTWEAFWRTAVDGRPAADVAADLGMTPGAVYVAKSRVLRRLREEFAGLLEWPPEGRRDVL